MAVKKPLVLTAGQIQELQSADEINIDASDVTTGTIATARLASGTANSTTFLRGDQTWASAGETTYTVTTADCENTSSLVRMVSFTVPANTWLDGERITLEVVRDVQNFTGSSQNSSTYIGGTTITEFTSTAPINNSVASTWKHRYEFYRIGNTCYYSRVFATALYELYSNAFNVFGQTLLVIDTNVTYSSDITIYIDHKFANASATLFQRLIWAKAYKTAAGQL